MLVNAGRWDVCFTKDGTLLYIPYITTQTADKIHRLLYFQLLHHLKFVWSLLTHLLRPIHSIICQLSCLSLFFILSIILFIGAWGWQPHHLHVSNVMKSGSLNLLEPSGPHRASFTLSSYLFIFMNPTFCISVLFLSLGDTLGRDVLSNVMFWFYRWRWRWWFRSKERTGSSHPNSSPVPTSSAQHSSPATDFREHLISLRDQLHSVIRSNPSRGNGVFTGKSKLGNLTDRLVCIVYVCSGFMLVFSKLTHSLP